MTERRFMAGYPDRRPDNSGLDDGPALRLSRDQDGRSTKAPEELAAMRARAWETRRARYGDRGHR